MFSVWQSGSSIPHRRCIDKEQAIEDCERLAEYCPASRFYVLDELYGTAIYEVQKGGKNVESGRR